MIKIKKNIFALLCIMVIILNSGYALSTINIRITYIIFIGAMVFMPLVFSRFKKKLDVLSCSVILLLFMIVCTAIISGLKGITNYGLLISNIVFAFGIVLKYDFKKFIRVFLIIMKWTAITAILGYILVNFIKIDIPLASQLNVNDVKYKIGYIFFYIETIPERNCGIFWEPGLFATFLIIAIVCEICFMERKINIINTAIYLLAILTTKSAAGYALIFLVIILFVIDSNNKQNNWKFLLHSIIFLISIIVIFNYSKIIEIFGLANNDVIRRLDINNVLHESRVYAIKHNLQLMKQSPIFGIGIHEANLNAEYISDTSNFTYMLSVFGMFGLQYTIYWIYGILKNKNNTLYMNIITMVIFILILNKEPHLYNTFMWCFMFYLLKNSNEREEYNGNDKKNIKQS